MMDLRKIAQFVYDEGFAAQRGVIRATGDDFLVFGNDGYNRDPRAKREVATVRERIVGQAEEIGFGLSAGGYSWVLLVRFHKSRSSPARQETRRTILGLALLQGWFGTDSGTVPSLETSQSEAAELVIESMRPQLLNLLENI
jgi:hypothetical protein